MDLVPESAIPAGFSIESAGAHGSRTIILGELRRLLATTSTNATYDDYRQAIVEDNVLGKRTIATRKESVRRLRELYAISPAVPLFRALRDLWHANPHAQPMLALLCAAARDPLLRATADLIVATPVGETVTSRVLEEAIAGTFPGRYNAKSLASIGRHVASSWQQSGHLKGRTNKIRSIAESHPESTAYALFLGHLCGAGGEGLFGTPWVALLDAQAHVIREQARAAARQGWLDYKSLGGVTEIGFPHFLRDEEEAA